MLSFYVHIFSARTKNIRLAHSGYEKRKRGISHYELIFERRLTFSLFIKTLFAKLCWQTDIGQKYRLLGDIMWTLVTSLRSLFTRCLLDDINSISK